MAAAGHPGEDAALFDAVHAVGMEFCPRLGISIPVGKDSMSMKTVWTDREGEAEAWQESKTGDCTAVFDCFRFCKSRGCAQNADATVAHGLRRDRTHPDRSWEG